MNENDLDSLNFNSLYFSAFRTIVILLFEVLTHTEKKALKKHYHESRDFKFKYLNSYEGDIR